MDHTCAEWCSLPAQFLSDNSEIPPDIVFNFKDASSDDVGVPAHKMLLAMASKIFRNMFYVHDTTDKWASQILIEDASKPDFQIMIDAVYHVKRIKDSLTGKSLHEIFAVLYLVTKYELHNLVREVQDCLSSFPVTEDTVLDVAADAMEYLATFEASANSILFACSKFLQPKFPTVKSLLRFVAENNDKHATVHKLMLIMDEITPTVCSNCNSEPCLNGSEVQVNQFRSNLKVAYNSTSFMWDRDLKYLNADILKIVSDKEVQVKYQYARIAAGSKEESKVTLYDKEWEGKLNFVFNFK